MPIMRGLHKRLAAKKPFAGLTIGICLHVEAKTAIWLEALTAGGAHIALTGSPGTTQDDVAAALSESGVAVYSRRAESFTEHLENCGSVLSLNPALIVDNGADLHFMIHREPRFEALSKSIIGATEETTSGGFRLREDLCVQQFPTIVINDSRAKRIIENRYGVGLSVVDGIMRSTNMLVAGLRVAVIGYGYCGRGVAICLRNLGAHVTVVEIDPLTALDAHLEGFKTIGLEDALAENEMIITVTGRDGIIRKEHRRLLNSGAILVNAGHFEFEIDVAGLRSEAETVTSIRDDIERFDFPDARKLFLLAHGRPVNLAAADGNPIEVMDLGLALQTLSLEHLLQHAGTMPSEPAGVPADVERAVSAIALKTWTRGNQ
jgi:adenosylhomocysteinase